MRRVKVKLPKFEIIEYIPYKIIYQNISVCFLTNCNDEELIKELTSLWFKEYDYNTNKTILKEFIELGGYKFEYCNNSEYNGKKIVLA
jgi:hypothetical protein